MDKVVEFRPVKATKISQDLTTFYEEFLEFQAYCALLCDAMGSIASTQMTLDEPTRRGVDMFASYLKRRVEEMTLVVKQIQVKSCEQPG